MFPNALAPCGPAARPQPQQCPYGWKDLPRAHGAALEMNAIWVTMPRLNQGQVITLVLGPWRRHTLIEACYADLGTRPDEVYEKLATQRRCSSALCANDLAFCGNRQGTFRFVARKFMMWRRRKEGHGEIRNS